ncbi:MAG: phosphoribosyltransferase family protein [Methanolobus sp.]|nr:phosphoribosyltransferase family protein [Methanolobus sp.]
MKLYSKLIDINNKANKTFAEKKILKAAKFCKKIVDANKNNRIVSVFDREFKGNITYVTIEDIIDWSNLFIKRFPEKYDLVIGIPRSGLAVANIVSLKLGLPLTTPDQYLNGKFWHSSLIEKKQHYEKILLIDDSVASGKSMQEAKELLSQHTDNITTAGLIVTKESKSKVDLYYKVIEQPRLFEWNIAHSKKGVLVSDLDGVICENCPPGYDSNENMYISWIREAKPYIIPSFEIDYIVTNRLEMYRQKTEEWLKMHDVKYKELIMWDLESKEQRNNQHAIRKTELIIEIMPDMVWESSRWESEEIFKNTHYPVLCFDDNLLFG